MRLLLAAALTLAAPAVLADEVWSTPMGDIVYEAERDGDAILSFIYLDDHRATLVIPGLAGNYDFRGTHEAFWISEGGGACKSTMTYDTMSSTTWGRALLVFDKPEYPTSLTLVLGECFGPLTDNLRGTSLAE